MLFKLSNLNSNLALTLGYLNPALNNSALMSITGVRIKRVEFSENVRAFQRTKKKLLLMASCPLKWVSVNRAPDWIVHDDLGEPIYSSLTLSIKHKKY